ncbi:hypothetical protein MUS1_09410 [Marinomonas ushuaiensis DSM 15871]|uniref:Uncharacterized protein n=1 Tax=Marinomonas ushuaiensis DSM 15871 TaxID=1122207 RepID=X7E6F4_9GAMM|nr:hypothetical protein MUS1_09410 [Marinomonas ushuaiensis DSM 15871]
MRGLVKWVFLGFKELSADEINSQTKKERQPIGLPLFFMMFIYLL